MMNITVYCKYLPQHLNSPIQRRIGLQLNLMTIIKQLFKSDRTFRNLFHNTAFFISITFADDIVWNFFEHEIVIAKYSRQYFPIEQLILLHCRRDDCKIKVFSTLVLCLIPKLFSTLFLDFNINLNTFLQSLLNRVKWDNFLVTSGRSFVNGFLQFEWNLI